MAKLKPNGAAATTPAEPEAPRKQIPTLRLDAVVLRENAQNDWCVVAPKGIAVEDLESPELWTVAAQRLRAFDLVRVVDSGRAWWAELLVLDAMPGRAKLKVIRSIGIEGLEAPPEFVSRIPANHRIFQGPPDEGWIVARDNPDGTVVLMAKGCDQSWWSQARALEWLLNHATVRDSLPPA